MIFTILKSLLNRGNKNKLQIFCELRISLVLYSKMMINNKWNDFSNLENKWHA